MKSLKYTFTFLVSLVIFASSCNGKKSAENEKLTNLKAEVIHEHDISMAKMGTLMKLKKELNLKKESMTDVELTASIDQTISELDQANDGMMEWMRSFTKNFPAGTLMDGDMDHGDQDKAEDSEKLDGQGFYNSLEAELVKIKKVDEEMDQAIEKAESILKAN